MIRCCRCAKLTDATPYVDFCLACGDWIEQHDEVDERHTLSWFQVCGWAAHGERREVEARWEVR